jgi:hypothetical protein
MSSANLVNSFGLVLDILGVVLIWKFGLPEPLSREGHSYFILEGSDETEKARAAKYDRWSKTGLALVVLGFAIQLGSNLLSS